VNDFIRLCRRAALDAPLHAASRIAAR